MKVSNRKFNLKYNSIVNRVAVRLGEHRISTETDCISEECVGSTSDDCFGDCRDPVQDILIEERIRHKDYDKTLKINDIALLRLKSPADTTKNNVRTICLPTLPDNQIKEITDSARRKMLISGETEQLL